MSNSPAFIQSYCTLDEMRQDADNSQGLPANVLSRFIRPASEYILSNIGQFIPLRDTLYFTGRDSATLFVPPLLRLTGDIDNCGVALVQATVILRSEEMHDNPAWVYGPFLRIESDKYGANRFLAYRLNGVGVPGVWGLFERIESTSAVISSIQNLADVILVVSDGSQLSPGMTLDIEGEMEFVNGYGSATAAITTLGAILDGVSETITVANGALLNVGEQIQVDFEKLLILDIQGNKCFVVRGWNKTLKTTHSSGANVAVFRTFRVDRGINGYTAAAHNTSAAVSMYTVPADVNYLAREIASLMMRKSATAFSGRSGNPESGETFYTHEFPRDVVDRVAANYYLPNPRQ